MAEILVVDDEAAIADLVEVCLKNEGYTVYKCGSGEAALTCVARQHLDLAILDVMLPDLDGFTLCQKIREEHLFPILMLTARDTVADRVAGLDCGADDYLIKPFSLKELDARLRALVRRAKGRQTRAVLRWEDVELDPAAHTAARAGVPLRLGPTAFAILETLLRAAPDVVPRAELERELWGDSPPDSDALRTHIHELRQKLDKPFAVPLLKTVPHVGYGLVSHARRSC